jgi:hypothetical protein
MYIHVYVCMYYLRNPQVVSAVFWRMWPLACIRISCHACGVLSCHACAVFYSVNDNNCNPLQHMCNTLTGNRTHVTESHPSAHTNALSRSDKGMFSLSLCVCIYIYIYLYIYMYICIYVLYIYIYIQIYIYIYVYMYTCIMYVCMYVRTYVCTYVCM